MSWQIWIMVPMIYGVFSLWYFNWEGPLSSEEIEEFLVEFENQEGSAHTQKAVIRKFLEEDDGKEFVMLNLVEIHGGDVDHPVTGEKQNARSLLTSYFAPFSIALMKRGGHPVLQSRTVGGNIDSWNADGNVSFSGTGMMRYKSRRDLIELVIDPAFADSHLYKLAAIERTISYPTQTLFSASLRPPITVMLVLLLLASLAQNILFVIRS